MTFASADMTLGTMDNFIVYGMLAFAYPCELC